MDLTANHAGSQAHVHAMSPAQRVWSILHWTYGLVPIAAGADKFMHVLTDWDKYLSPSIANILPMSAHSFMNIVGIIEIVAGVLVLVKPRIGSIVVAFWLIGIAINLVLTGQYYDVAVRDIVMSIGAFCLFILSDSRTRD
jgi:uncharacterized membrane protein YphA (DoxX/SURF4 family)